MSTQDREMIARIIDPAAWEWDHALAKADAILLALAENKATRQEEPLSEPSPPAATSGGRSVTRFLRASLEFAVVAACVYLVIRLLAIWGG